MAAIAMVTRHFGISILSLVCAVYVGYVIGGVSGAIDVLILAVLEIALSFDNAIVNARILRNWDPFWQRLFLTVGIFVAVFVVRFLIPILTVMGVTGNGFSATYTMAVYAPEEYRAALLSAHHLIVAFGATFLYLVVAEFFFDATKRIHWIRRLEEQFKKMGAYGMPMHIGIALVPLVLMGVFVIPAHEKVPFVMSGLFGITAYASLRWLSSRLTSRVKSGVPQGISGLMFLETLDASYSLDSVVGAFAISLVLYIIMLGLGVGAMFVRSFTVFMVRTGEDKKYVFLAHGAFWAMLSLATAMYVGLAVDLPDVVTSGSSVVFIGLSLWSSIRLKRQRVRRRQKLNESA